MLRTPEDRVAANDWGRMTHYQDDMEEIVDHKREFALAKGQALCLR
jgi:hypothetical protein